MTHPGEIAQYIIKTAMAADKPDLEKGPDMVYHFWGDGEITLQKAGELLWQRSLHQVKSPILPAEFAFQLPRGSGKVINENAKTYIAIDDKAVMQDLRVKMAEWMLGYVKHIPVS